MQHQLQQLAAEVAQIKQDALFYEQEWRQGQKDLAAAKAQTFEQRFKVDCLKKRLAEKDRQHMDQLTSISEELKRIKPATGLSGIRQCVERIRVLLDSIYSPAFEQVYIKIG